MVIVGVDEVGRGCWAGPLVAAAVILKQPIPGLKDSKKLSKKRREKLSVHIKKQAQAIGLGWVEPAVIDSLGLTQAVSLAMHQAIGELKVPYDEIVVDGDYNFLADNPKAKTLIKADSLIPAVSAASIIAKVARDSYMTSLADAYPDYAFEKHVGYGTALHLERLKLHGVSDQHRRSYKPVQVFDV
jgi:ribonuclease HII